MAPAKGKNYYPPGVFCIFNIATYILAGYSDYIETAFLSSEFYKNLSGKDIIVIYLKCPLG